jgi:hypothetical protein
MEVSFARASFTGRSDTPNVSATHEDLQYPPEMHLPREIRPPARAGYSARPKAVSERPDE